MISTAAHQSYKSFRKTKVIKHIYNEQRKQTKQLTHQIFSKFAEWENDIYNNLTKAAKTNGHFKVYHRENIPKRWNVNNERRMGPIFAVADIKYAFQDMFDTAEFYRKKFNIPSKFY